MDSLEHLNVWSNELMKQCKWKIQFHQTFTNLSKTRYPCLMKMFDAFESALKAHQQISKTRCFAKYCSCDKACQFSALQGTP